MSWQWNNFFYSKFFLSAILIAVVFVGFGYGRAYYQDFKVKEEIALLEEEAKKLEVKKLESLEILKYVQSDEFAEAKARTELNLIKPGENMAIVKKNDLPLEIRQVEKEVVSLNNIPNPVKWWRYFMEREK